LETVNTCATETENGNRAPEDEKCALLDTRNYIATRPQEFVIRGEDIARPSRQIGIPDIAGTLPFA
jgi:hypothetical protein